MDQPDDDRKNSGKESYEEVMSSLGLSDLKPVSRAVEFDGDDPLGARAINRTSCGVSTVSNDQVL